MTRFLLGTAAALALAGAAPAYACGDDCPMHKEKTAAAASGTQVAAADKADKKDAKVTCACTNPKECTCAAHGKCDCPTCHAKKEKKEEPKKS